MRRPKNYVTCKCLAISVPGVGPLGSPRKRWLDVVMQDMRGNSLTTEDAKDRAKLSSTLVKAEINARKKKKKRVLDKAH